MSLPFLTDEWMEMVLVHAASLPQQTDVDADLQVEVAGSPSGKLRITVQFEAGQLTTLAAGANKGAACGIIIAADVAAGVIQGDIDPSVAYMRGDLKLDKAYELVLFDLRPLAATDEWKQFVAAVAADTDFGS